MYQAFIQDVYNETKLLSEGYTDGYEDGQKTRKRARPEGSAGEETMLLFGALSSEIQLVRNEMMLLFLLLRDRHKGAGRIRLRGAARNATGTMQFSSENVYFGRD